MCARKTTVTSSVITLLIFTGVCASDWVSFPGGTNEPEPPTLTVLESNEQQTVLRITIPGMLVNEVKVDGEVYDKRYVSLFSKPGLLKMLSYVCTNRGESTMLKVQTTPVTPRSTSKLVQRKTYM
jgi:hypothetical protein